MRPVITLIPILLFAQASLAQPTPLQEANLTPQQKVQLDDAIHRATSLLEKGVKNYPVHRSCFSCHHQALPLFAFSIGNLQSDKQDSFYQGNTTKHIVDFTTASFRGKVESLNSGAEIGGKALTVAYGLWTFDLAGAESNEVSRAMVENLIQTQDKEGAWNFQSTRPPAASSRLMTTAVAVYGLRSYGEESSKERIDSALNRAFEWSLAQSSDSHEDLIGQIWLESMIIEEQDRAVNDRLGMLRNRLLESQRSDGGWSQMAEMSSDAYATGQAVIMLSHLSNVRNDGRASSAQQRAAKFLLENQQPDGSWYVASRSKPVQVFFDNGDPHGKDQFISIMATSWATAALREIKFQTLKPLVSVRVAQRLGRIAND